MNDPRSNHPKSATETLELRVEFFEVRHEDYGAFSRIARSLRKFAPAALDRFYGRVANTPAIASFFPTSTSARSARDKQYAHWVDLFEKNTGGLSQSYFQRASHIGDVHARIGLEPTWYTGAYATILQDVIKGMVGQSLAGRLGGRAMAQDIATLVKLAIMDMDIALGAYFRAEEAKRQSVVDSLSHALEAMANGDMTHSLTDLPPGYAKLQEDFEAMRRAVNAALNGVTAAVETISAGSAEIRSASDNLSTRTEHQAATLEETTAAMNSLTHGISDAAQGASRVEASVSEAQDEAQKGSEVVREAVDAMASIENSAREITQIINVIDGIAFQTNLLALNAGVEAARAGDAGKGFAVVANEVRALAQRSAEAAKDIRGLIGTSVDQVTRGVSLVDQSGQAFTRITGKVADIASLAITIASLSREQAGNLVQINESVGDIDRNTQANAAIAEEATAAARSLASQAQELAQLVARFRIERTAGSSLTSLAELSPAPIPLHRAKSPPKLVPVPRSDGALAIQPTPEAANEADDWAEF